MSTSVDPRPVVARLRAAGCVFAEDEADLLLEAASGPSELDRLVARRVEGLPLEHLLGWAEFGGLRISVAPGVFVPRRRSEALVHEAVALLDAAAPAPLGPSTPLGPSAPASAPARVDSPAPAGAPSSVGPPAAAGAPSSVGPPAAAGAPSPVGPPARAPDPARAPAGGPGPLVVVDLCCGAGAIGAALAAQFRPSGTGGVAIELHAAEIDPAAVACARQNLAPFGGHVHQGDLDAPLPAGLRGRVSVLVANVPYVPTEAIATMPPEARDHEPRVALDGGADGLDVARRVAAAAPGWLAPGGSLLIETGEEQAPLLAGVFAGNGLAPRVVTDDELGSTVVVGTRT